MNRLLFFLIVLFFVDSCVILPEWYYEPVSGGGVSVSSGCGSYLKSAMLNKFQDVQLIVELGYRSRYVGNEIFDKEYPIHELKNSDFEGRMGVEVIVKAPKGSTFNFMKNEFIIEVNGMETEALTLERFIYLSPKPPYKFLIVSPTVKQYGYTVDGGSLQADSPLDFRGTLWPRANKINTLLVKFPVFNVNGREYQITNVLFRLEKKWTISPLNC